MNSSSDNCQFSQCSNLAGTVGNRNYFRMRFESQRAFASDVMDAGMLPVPMHERSRTKLADKSQ